MLITVEELKRKLSVKESWIRSQIHARKIPFIKVGRHIRFDESAIEQWISKDQKSKGDRK